MFFFEPLLWHSLFGVLPLDFSVGHRTLFCLVLPWIQFLSSVLEAFLVEFHTILAHMEIWTLCAFLAPTCSVLVSPEEYCFLVALFS